VPKSIFLAVAGLTAALCAARPASAGEILAGSPKAALAAELIARERDSWRFYRARDAAALTAMTSEDFADLYSSGEVVGRQRWLKDMAGITVERSRLGGFHAFELTPDSILLTYEGEAWGRTQDGPAHNRAKVTSAWARRHGRWLNVFYGETALDPASTFYGAARTRHR